MSNTYIENYNIDYTQCDESIVPLLQKINSKLWIKTLYSCGGKTEHGSSYGDSGYISVIVNDVNKLVTLLEKTREFQIINFNYRFSSIYVDLQIDESKFFNFPSDIPNGWLRFNIGINYIPNMDSLYIEQIAFASLENAIDNME